MAELDFKRAAKLARLSRGRSFVRRPDNELPFVSAPEAGAGVLLDTCVYIDQLQGAFPSIGISLLETRVPHHSVIAISELMFAVGRLDPFDARTSNVVDRIGSMIELMQLHRLVDVDIDILARAAVLAGILARVQGYGKDDQRRAVNDAIIFLQAAKYGLTVFTRNVADFDILLQIVPSGRVLFYRRDP